MKKVLVTGFDPFGGESINPSYEAVKLLKGEYAGIRVIKAEIPTVLKKSVEKLKKLIEEHDPDIIICCGQAGGRTAITPERVAINVDDARIKDNEGNQPFDEPVIEGAESAYFSNLPVKKMVLAVKEKGIAAELSNTAGTFICNHLMFGLLHLIATKYPEKKGGFIHVPYIPEQVEDKPGVFSMPLETIKEGLEAAILVSIEEEDAKTARLGKTH